jgi:hypothetical protein
MAYFSRRFGARFDKSNKKRKKEKKIHGQVRRAHPRAATTAAARP